MTETETITTTEATDPTPSWEVKVLALIEAFERGELQDRLRELDRSAPTEKEPLERATAAIAERFGLTDKPESEWVTLARKHNDDLNRKAVLDVGNIVQTLLNLADSLRIAEFAAGEPVVRLDRHSGIQAAIHNDKVIAEFDSLPRRSPFREIPSVSMVFRDHYMQCIVLGDPAANPKWYRLSDAQRLTAVVREEQCWRAEEESRRIKRERQAEEDRRAATPEAIAARLGELEAEVSRMRSEKAGA